MTKQKFDFLRRIFIIIVAMLQPFILYLYVGYLPSLSSSWETDLQPLFIMTNAVVSYFFFDFPKWRIPSVCLLVLTAFPVTVFSVFHNIVAVLFFISCVWGLQSIKRFRWFLIPYAFAVPVGIFYGLYWFETVGILVLCAYHLNLLIYRNIYLNRNNQI